MALAVTVFGLMLIGVLGFNAAEDQFSKPTAMDILSKVYPNLPIVPAVPNAMIDPASDSCTFYLFLEAEPADGANGEEPADGVNGECELIGRVIPECSGVLVEAMKKRLLAKDAQFSVEQLVYGQGPCEAAKRHEGKCVVQLANMSTTDFAPDGKVLSCGDWVASTECNGMEPGYDAAKGKNHDSCSALKRFKPPTPIELLQKCIYPHLPIPPMSRNQHGFSRRSNIPSAGSCRITLKNEAIKEGKTDSTGAEFCRLRGSVASECDDPEVVDAMNKQAGSLKPLDLFGGLSCEFAQSFAYTCVMTIDGIALEDFDSKGNAITCGDWTASTKCDGFMEALESLLNIIIEFAPCRDQKRLAPIGSGTGHQWPNVAAEEGSGGRGWARTFFILALCLVFALAAVF